MVRTPSLRVDGRGLTVKALLAHGLVASTTSSNDTIYSQK